MKISEISTRCPNFKLSFRPKYGWGWTAPQGEPVIEYEQIDRFGKFQLSVSGVFQFQGDYRGFYGDVIEKEHPLSGLGFILWSMCGSDPDLRESEDARWDLFFSKDNFNPDHNDFSNPDSAGVGYGNPILSENA